MPAQKLPTKQEESKDDEIENEKISEKVSPFLSPSLRRVQNSTRDEKE